MPHTYSKATLESMTDDERRRRHLPVRNPIKKAGRVLPDGDWISTTVRLDRETYERIQALAKRFKQNQTKTLQDLIEWGLMSVAEEDSDRRESAV